MVALIPSKFESVARLICQVERRSVRGNEHQPNALDNVKERSKNSTVGWVGAVRARTRQNLGLSEVAGTRRSVITT